MILSAMCTKLVLLLLVLITVKCEFSNNIIDGEPYDPDIYLTAPEIIRRHGYVSESHVVQTTDGYLLTVHRIPVNKYGQVGNQPVLLQHGLLSSSADWVLEGNRSLAFILSDLGYDVWMNNARGNIYSRGHVSIPLNTDQFWNFSFHEMGVYDISATISYIGNITNKQGDIIYIGHSMGTTMFFVFASILPQFAVDNIKTMVALAPVAYMKYITSPIRYLTGFTNDFEWIREHLGVRQFLPDNEVMKLLSWECELFRLNKVCKQIIFLICGFDSKELTEQMLSLILSHDPAGSSTKTLIHYAQEIRQDGSFMQFDYGTAKNMVKYNSTTPPFYNLTNIKVPLHLMYADNDLLANSKDILRLASEVSGEVSFYHVPLKYFNHVDFIFAKDAPTIVYKNLIKYILKYN